MDNALIASFRQCDRMTKNPVCAEICTPLAKPVIPALILFCLSNQHKLIENESEIAHLISSSAWFPSLIRDWRGWAEGSAWLPPSEDVKRQFVIHSILHGNYFLGHNHKIPPVVPVISSRRTQKLRWISLTLAAVAILTQKCSVTPCHISSSCKTDPWVMAPKWVTQSWHLTHSMVTTRDLLFYHPPTQESVCSCSFVCHSPWEHCCHCRCEHAVKLSLPFGRTSKSCQTTAAISCALIVRSCLLTF